MITIDELNKKLFWNGDKTLKVVFITDVGVCFDSYRTWNKLMATVDKNAEVLSIQFTKKKIKLVIKYNI